MLPAPLNLFPALMAPLHFLRIYSAQSEGRKLKKDEIQEAKRQALRVQVWNASAENGSHSSIAMTPTQQAQSPQSSSPRSTLASASPQLYVISLAGSLSDDIIKFLSLPLSLSPTLLSLLLLSLHLSPLLPSPVVSVAFPSSPWPLFPFGSLSSLPSS
jgi:hypothetical protein